MARSSNLPAIHRAHPTTAEARDTPSRMSGILDSPRELSRGVGNHYESPATEPKLQGCTSDHIVKVMLIRDLEPTETTALRDIGD